MNSKLPEGPIVCAEKKKHPCWECLNNLHLSFKYKFYIKIYIKILLNKLWLTPQWSLIDSLNKNSTELQDSVNETCWHFFNSLLNNLLSAFTFIDI